ncbi:SMC family ATPase [Actinomyces radicidentis]|uniref:SMC family ATPase n=1 Tax=Actinomyces radicidentis TaxID=111015 RepID=UPI0028ECFD14|nr:SMC family ATPase [Actinomyces radicidentis]
MRLHRLTMTGIGPYAGTETVDFDRFAESGRFLLTGPTGAGKSTIIDAIVFALFGSVADTAGSSKQRLRSTLAAPSDPSEVELVFSTSAGTYRIRRTPEYMRPKRRGTGLTKENTSVRLWRLAATDGEARGEPLTRVDEVGQEMRRVVGLSRDQFTQTVVLPQGRFAQFLRASSAERHELLRDVFGTAVFDALQEELRERGRVLRRGTDAAREALRSRAEVLAPLLPEEPTAEAGGADATGAGSLDGDDADAGTAGPGTETSYDPGTDPSQPDLFSSLAAGRPDAPEEHEERPSPAEELRALVEAAVPDADAISTVGRDAVARADADLVPLAEAVETARVGRADAAGAVEAAVSLQERLDRRARLVAERDALETSAQADAADAERLERARRAASVASAHTALRRAEQGARAEEATARQSLAEAAEGEHDDDALAPVLETALEALEVTAGDRPDGATDGLEAASAALAHAADEARSSSGALRPLAELEAGLTTRATELERGRAELAGREEALSSNREALEARPARQNALESRLQAARTAAAGLDGLRLARTAAEERLGQARTADALEAALGEAVTAVERARDAASSAAATVAKRRGAWIAATAASIVGELEEGAPCPVCGSTEHPAPASPEPGAVTRKQVEAAEKAQRTADDALASAASEHARITRELESARAAAGAASIEDLESALTETEARLTASATTAAEEPALAEALEGFTARTAELRAALDAESAALAAARSRAEAAEEQLQADRSRCEAARGDHPDVAGRMRALTARAAKDDAGATALSRVLAAWAAAGTAAEDLRTALTTAGFETAEAASAAALPPDDLRLLEEGVASVRARRERVEHGLTRDESLASLTGEEVADVDGARARLAEADARQTSAVETVERARAARGRLADAAGAVESSACALEEAVAGAAALAQVVEAVSGQNPESTPLATWVLLERFNDVLVFANNRLAQMSAGRYELVRVDDESGSAGRRDKGLGLGVVDRLAGDGTGVRDPRTLSGGETFYVSLALALALADVVSAEAGGVQMETLFVDEGFGSLDPETLQMVLGELSRLQEGGRTVGIVSHVEELRRQVLDRIEVTRTDNGSTLRVVAP